MITYSVKVYDGGSEFWYLDNEFHREGAPAIVNHKTGYKAWYQHGKLHNEHGAAVRLIDGTLEFWLNGRKFGGSVSWQIDLDDRRKAEEAALREVKRQLEREAREKRRLLEDELLFAMMNPPMFIHPVDWVVQPKGDLRDHRINWGHSPWEHGFFGRWADVQVQANAFLTGWTGDNHKELTVAEVEQCQKAFDAGIAAGIWGIKTKELTVAEIETMLGHKVKIIKEK